ncbi:uncharacterized protein [Branchiostoma lanceolatum]|uniref:uncharacterized protein n=1 Tax=Branchiostoma lanceolatum TaxID=7740 RepID=UPI0034543B6F
MTVNLIPEYISANMMLFWALALTVATTLPAPGATQDPQGYFDNLDINGDGFITLHEAEHGLTVHALFTAMDADCDGVITLAQINFYMPEFVPVFNNLDLDGNQSVTDQEAQAATSIAGVFTFFDTNADGLLERPEAQRLIDVINRLAAAAADLGNTACGN